ncbi:response regulator [Gynuella sunshinyii]|uniref:Sensory/regulatory protein RpfC n=1 Tax=Gynuella sunshinyii YC6258 TaxID=1445510 RepID=A0A0C5VX75_9GAMM|nr:transporter substrate-binding domain-containing protein [Gynuella sunshinyii]AJQ95039.1 signal transduction histidine kinase [Gynuella sunshinyii YC6258]
MDDFPIIQLRWLRYLSGILLILISSVVYAEQLSADETLILQAINEFQQDLTDAERYWLSEHRNIRVAVNPDYPPFSSRLPDDSYVGLGPDYLRVFGRMLGVKWVNVPAADWTEIVEIGVRQDVDVIVTSSDSQEYDSFFRLTETFLPVTVVIVTRRDNTSLQTPGDLHGRVVALIPNYAASAALVRDYPDIKGVFVRSPLECLQAVESGRAEACVESIEVSSHLMRMHQLNGLKFAAVFSGDLAPQGFAIRNDWPQLVALIDKALQILPEELKNRWYERQVQVDYKPQVSRSAAIEFRLTAQERSWLNQHNEFRVAFRPANYPVEFTDDHGRYTGISADYMKRVEELLGVRLTAVPLNVPQSVSTQLSRGRFDMTTAVDPKSWDGQGLLYTKPYLMLPMVIITREGSSYISNMSLLNNLPVSTVADDIATQLIRENHPSYILRPTKDVQSGLNMVLNGSAEAFIGNLTAISYIMSREGLTGLKVAGGTPYNYELAVGVVGNQPILTSILDKTLDVISENERNEIYRKWFSVTLEKRIDYTQWIRSIVIAGLAILLFFFWSLSLRRQVSRRTHELEVSQAKLNRAQELAHIGSWSISDVTTGQLQWSAETYRIFGVAVDTPITYSNFMEFVHPADREMMNRAWKQALRGDNYDIEHRIVVNQQVKWVEEKAELELAEDGSLKQCIGTVQDITERKLSSQELIKTTRALRVISSVNEAMVRAISEDRLLQDACYLVVHFGGYVRAWIGFAEYDEHCSIKPVSYAGCNSNSLSGFHWHWSESMQNRGLAGDAIVGHQFQIIQNVYTDDRYQVWRADAREYGYRSVAALPIDVGEALPAVLVIYAEAVNVFDDDELAMLRDLVADIGYGIQAIRAQQERKRVTAELMKSRDMLEIRVEERTRELEEARIQAVEANHAKSEFLAMMSHEIRTPINGIMGMAELALNTELNADSRGYIEKAFTSAHSLLGIINDVLDFSKIEAGHLELELMDFDLNDVLERITNVVGLRAQDKGLEFVFDIGSDVPMGLVGDPTRLGQVLINLGGNAVKFTERGEIVIRIQQQERTADRVTLRFDVKDTGIGIAEEKQRNLFDMFTQADNSVNRQYGGTGLGLSISKRLVEAMGGELKVNSRLGSGSTFYFSIQLGYGQDSFMSGRTMASAEREKHRILIVDDNVLSVDILSEMVAGLGFRVTGCTAANEAISELERAEKEGDPYSLVLLDWIMPDMDGVTLAKAVREHQQLQNPPVVVMVTAYDLGELSRQAREREIELHNMLVKPVTPSALLDSLVAALGDGVALTVPANSLIPASDEAMKTLLSGHRVLLVEDNEINQDMAMDALRQAGTSVALAENGQQAIDRLETEDFDIVLMDVHMPVMDGMTATKILRANPKYSDLPIIALTANALAGDRERFLSVGMNDYLSKPVRIQELLRTVAKWLARLNQTDQSPSEDQNVTKITSHDADTSARYEGLNVAEGLEYCNHNMGLYRRSLQKYLKYTDFVDQFNRLMADGDMDVAGRQAHTLKGSSGAIGAQQIQQLSKELQLACESSDIHRIDGILPELADALNITCGSIGQFLEGE